MTTIELTYNEKNSLARKTLEYILSLGFFKVKQTSSPARRKTLKAMEDARNGENITSCASFEEYLKAVAE